MRSGSCGGSLPTPVAARTVVIGSLAAITGFLVGGLSEYNFGDSEVVMVAWAIAALPSVVALRRPPRTASRGRGSVRRVRLGRRADLDEVLLELAEVVVGDEVGDQDTQQVPAAST